MAKKRAELDADEGAGFFDTNYQEARTHPEAADLELGDAVGSYRVDVQAAEWQRLDAIAAEMGVTRDKAATLALRSFLKQYDAGGIQMVKKPRHRVYHRLRNEVQLLVLSAYFKVFDKPKQS